MVRTPLNSPKSGPVKPTVQPVALVTNTVPEERAMTALGEVAAGVVEVKRNTYSRLRSSIMETLAVRNEKVTFPSTVTEWNRSIIWEPLRSFRNSAYSVSLKGTGSACPPMWAKYLAAIPYLRTRLYPRTNVSKRDWLSAAVSLALFEGLAGDSGYSLNYSPNGGVVVESYRSCR